MQRPSVFYITHLTLVLTFITTFVIWGAISETKLAIAGDGPAIGSSLEPAPNLRLTYFWNLESRRDGPYAVDGSNGSWAQIENKLESVDTYLFGMMQTFLDMDISGHIEQNHTERAWVSIYSTTTNYPFNRVEDDPPHVNVHAYWPDYEGDTNAHFTVDSNGHMKSNWYANDHSARDCGPDGRVEPEPGQWVNKIDNACATIFQERYTAAGEAQFRISPNHEIYTLANRKTGGQSSLNIYLGEELIYNVERTLHDPSEAVVRFDIKDFRQKKRISHQLNANPDTGELRSYEVEESELADEGTTILPGDNPSRGVALPPGANALPALPATNKKNVAFVATDGSDDNSGSLNSPWRTLAKAADSATAGDTIYIRGGTYTEELSPVNSGEPGAMIVFAAYPGEMVILDGMATQGGDYGAIVDIDDVSYVRVSGLKIINAEYYGFRVGGGASHIILDNNTLDFIYSSAFYISASDNVTVHGNQIERTTHGIGSEQLRENDGTYVAPQEHISVVSGATDFEIRFNTITNPYINNGHRQSKEGIDIKNGVANGKVYGNTVSGIRNMGIYVDGYESTVRNIQIFGNTVTDNQNGIVVAAERGGQVDGIDIYNNVVYNNGYERTIDGEASITGGDGIRVFDSDEGGATDNIAIFHNTIFNNRSQGITVSNPDSENITIVNNISYMNDDDQIFVLPEIANIVSISSNFTSDPLFVDPVNYDLRLTVDSPAINGADSTLSTSYDHQFFVRDSQPDIGSFEYGATQIANLPYSTFLPIAIPYDQ